MASLAATYAAYNRRYFRSRLPKDITLRWTSRLPNGYGLFDGDNTIYINRDHRKWKKMWRLTLLHEMAHLATASEKAEHGPQWLREMRRLARIGAFNKLW